MDESHLAIGQEQVVNKFSLSKFSFCITNYYGILEIQVRGEEREGFCCLHPLLYLCEHVNWIYAWPKNLNLKMSSSPYVNPCHARNKLYVVLVWVDFLDFLDLIFFLVRRFFCILLVYLGYTILLLINFYYV
jgi:hypothetical protein